MKRQASYRFTTVTFRGSSVVQGQWTKVFEHMSAKNCELKNRQYDCDSRLEENLWRRENLRLQTELLASQERVFELQDKLLALRRIVNSVTVQTKEWSHARPTLPR